MAFSSATTGRVFSEITPQNANPIGYHLERFFENCSWATHKKFGFLGYHLRTTMDKKRFSLATTWEIDNQPFKLRCKPPWKNRSKKMLSRVRIWMFFLEVYEDCFPKPVDKSLLNVLTSRGIFFCSRWKLPFESPNTVRDIQKLDG